MRHRAERIPRVIAIDVSSDEYGNDEEAMNSSVTQETESAGAEESSNDSSATSSAANSDDNALFDSEEDDSEQEKKEQEASEGEKMPEENLQKTSRATITCKVNTQVESVLKACLALLETNTSETQSNQEQVNQEQDATQNSYINSWALQNGYGYYMNNQFYCFFNRESCCNASFPNNHLLSLHLEKVHNVPKAIDERYSREHFRDKKMAHWLIATNLPIKIVLSSHFNVFMRATREQPSTSVPAVSKEGVQRMIRAEVDIISAELSQRLKNIEHISLVVNQWKDANQNSILFLSIFFIDEDWNKKTLVIAAEPLHNEESRTNILLKIVLVLKDLDILGKIYSITCYETDLFEESHLFAYIEKIMGKNEMQLVQDRVYSKLLDKMVIELRVELLSSLRYDCEPLKKILREIDNCNCNMVLKEMQPYSIKLMKAYLENKHNHHIDCTMRRYMINEVDEECMEQIIQLDNELAYICEWLYEVAERNCTIANKAYVICCELGNSIKKLAELRSSRRAIHKSTTAKNCEVSDAVKKATCMKRPLEAMHKILSAYRSKLERGQAHVEAFVYDSYAYNDSYFSASKALSLSKQPKSLTVILEDIANQGDKRHRGVDIIDLLGFNNEKRQQYEDPDLATSSSNNIISGKRRRSNQSTVIAEPTPNQAITDQIQLFRQKQLEYFRKYPDPSVVSSNLPHSRIRSILSDHTVVGQFNFWKQENQKQIPVLVQHTKKVFAIPTTSQECVRSFDSVKKLYTQIAEQEADSDVDFICKRALLSVWSVDFNLFKD
ncbi:hypothetical protein BD408DRAFT_441278 [Parasitella parasitica]|nr:hypothetical protein BD408DRAFT_441278 [Parasitella parasitica]